VHAAVISVSAEKTGVRFPSPSLENRACSAGTKASLFMSAYSTRNRIMSEFVRDQTVHD